MKIFSWFYKFIEHRKFREMTKELCWFSGSSEIDKNNIVEQILEHANFMKADGIVVMPLPTLKDSRGAFSTITASMQLEMDNVALAVCEEPLVLFVNYNAIRALLAETSSRKLLKSLPNWHTLLFVLFNAGFRLAKIYPNRQFGWIRIFSK